MTLSATTLFTELDNMPLFSDEGSAISAWANAFDVYFKEATASLGGLVLPAGLLQCKPSMESELLGASEPNQGAIKIKNGIIAYWGAINAPGAWVTALVVSPPPGLSALESALQSVFTTNRDSNNDKSTALLSIATTIHAANLGGICQFPPIASGGLGPQPII